MYSTFYLSMQYCNNDELPKIIYKKNQSSLYSCTGQVTAFCFNRVRIVGKQHNPSRNCNEEAFLKITQIN